MSRIFFLLLGLSLLMFSRAGFASMTYTPGSTISLTGATTDVRFDVASVVHGTSFSGAYLDTTTRTMSGVFYMNSIGWAMMSSGSYQVGLDCGGQSLGALTTSCQFTGSGWSENIGEIGFQSVQYLPSTGTLTGSIRSFAGDFSVVGIYMPLHPASLNQTLSLDIPANHAARFTISNVQRYVGNPWRLDVSNLANNPVPFSVSGGADSVGVFDPVDLQKTGNYIFTITDPHGGITEYDGIDVIHGMPQNMSLTKTPSTGIDPVPADGVSHYDMVLSFTDQYSNPVTTGDVVISYTGSVSETQLPPGIALAPYSTNFRDTLVFGGDFVTTYDGTDLWQSATITLSTTPITYSLASIAPTDAPTNNIILPNRITYTSPSGVMRDFTDATPIEFARPYTATAGTFAPVVGAANNFDITFASSTSESLNPENINLLEIGNGILASYTNLSTTETATAASPDNNWIINSTPSRITVTNPPASYTFSGIYTPNTAYPSIESVQLYSLIHYNIAGTDVVYLSDTEDTTAEYNASRVRILGQNNARSEYGTIGTNSNTRTSFVSALRKNISLMNRGRTTYDDVEYIAHTSDVSVGNSSFDIHHGTITRDTVIVLGADITITENIAKRTDRPLAIIALADESGNGGNIIIEDDVTDVHAGLFAEHAVRSSGDNQLYVYGTIISGNTLGETAAGICPYYVQGPCNARDYDLEYLRGYDGSVGQLGSSKVSDFPGSALIIEYDMRFQSDPPPGIPEQ